MAATVTPSLRSSMERLKHAGAVNGLCLCWRRQVLVNLLPYEDFRAERLLHVLLDAREHFSGGGREVENFWFGYEGAHVLGVFHGECALVILHSRCGDVDFLAKAGMTFLQDSQLLVNAALNPSGSDAAGDETQPIEAGDESSPPTHVIPRSTMNAQREAGYE